VKEAVAGLRRAIFGTRVAMWRQNALMMNKILKGDGNISIVWQTKAINHIMNVLTIK
jgi:hypothetical protein